MGMRRRSRRRGLLVGAAAGGAIAHHRAKRQAQDEADQAEADQAPVDDHPYAPPAATAADELEHLAQLHSTGVLTDEEFTSAKAKVLGS